MVAKRLRSLQVSASTLRRLMPCVMPAPRDCWPPACLSRRSAITWDTLNPDTTRIYAKVDLVGLRQVADFDLGGVL